MAISVGDVVLKLSIDKGNFNKGMASIGQTIKQHQRAIGIGMAAIGTAVVGGLALSLKMASDFEGAMREVNTMIGLSQEEFAEFSKDVQKLSADLGVNAVDSARALYQAISAGIPRENVLAFLEIATKAAIGGVTDTETAVDGLTTVLNAFKIPVNEAQRVADVMFTTVKGGKTTFDELSASLFQVAPIAAASGVSFEEVAAALATMTKQGVPTSVATTQLRQAMVALQKPTADMNTVINDLGYESGQAMLEELGLAKSLNVLRDATDGNNEMLMKMFGSVEAGAAVLALTGDNAVTFAGDLDAMAESSGAATEAFEEMENSVSRQMTKLKTSFSDVAISVGNVLIPILKDIVDKITPIIQSVKDWIDEHPGLTKVIVIAAGVLGGLLIVLGSLLLILPQLVAGWKLLKIAISLTTSKVKTSKIALIAQKVAMLAVAVATKIVAAAQWLWNAAISANPIGLIILAIVAFGAAVFGLVKLVVANWDTIKEKTIAIFTNIKDFFVGIWANIKNVFATTINWMIDRINSLIGLINKIPFVNIGEIGHIGGTSIVPSSTGLRMQSAMLTAAENAPFGVFRTANITLELDGETLARAVGEPLVEQIRIGQAIR